jgi:hypothetical protein
MDTYVLCTLSSCVTTIVTFDLWMNQSGFDTFALVMNFIDDGWVPKHVTVSFFEAPNITSVTLAKIIKPLFAKFKLTHKIIAYVKDNGSNLNTLVVILFTIFFVSQYSWNHHLQGFILDMQCPKLVSVPPMCWAKVNLTQFLLGRVEHLRKFWG